MTTTSSFAPTVQVASLDGELMPADEAKIAVTDTGLVRGDGVFEVMRIYGGVVFALDQHFARLERSARNLRLPIDAELLRAEADTLVAAAGPGPAHELLRIMVTRGGRRILLTEPMPPEPEIARLKTITYNPTLVLDGIKSLSYGANMLASRLAVEQGYDEGLLVTPEGRVLEAPTSSLFWVKDGQLRTPPLTDHILASITRALLLEVSDAVEYETSLSELLQADEVFLASTVREVQPVSQIDAVHFTVGGPVSTSTAKAAGARIQQLVGRA